MALKYELLLSHWEVFLLILIRLTAFIHTAPFFSIPNVPRKVKIGLAFFVSYVVFMTLPEQTYVYDNLFDYALLILRECVVGITIGFSANICLNAIHFAGHIIDVNIGLSMATMYDPATKMQVNVSGNLYYYFILILMLISDLHQFLLKAIVDTYTVLPIGEANMNPNMYENILKFIVDYFSIGFRIALPVFATIMLLNCILGIITRITPQINMFSFGMQIKVFVGLLVMYVTVVLLPVVARFLIDNMKTVIVTVVEGFV